MPTVAALSPSPGVVHGGSDILSLTWHPVPLGSDSNSLLAADPAPSRFHATKSMCLPAAFVGSWWAAWFDLQKQLQGALALSRLHCSPITMQARLFLE